MQLALKPNKQLRRSKRHRGFHLPEPIGGFTMDKKTTLATLAFCLGAGQAHAATGPAREVDLRTLQLLAEESISYDEFQLAVQTNGSGTYSNHSISSGTYSNHSISSATYSNHSISSGTYSNHSISAATYSNHSISGAPFSLRDTNVEIPGPVLTGDQN
jgi:hypothetical protein